MILAEARHIQDADVALHLRRGLDQVCSELRTLRNLQNETRDAVLRLVDVSSIPKMSKDGAPSRALALLEESQGLNACVPSCTNTVKTKETRENLTCKASPALPRAWPDVPLRAELRGPLVFGTEFDILAKEALNLVQPGQCMLRAVAPYSPLHLFFLFLTSSVVMTELTLLPVVLVWSIEREGWLLCFSWFSVTFWTVDIMLRCATGYQEGEQVEQRLRKTSERNWCTCFALDAFALACDWVSTVTEILLQKGTFVTAVSSSVHVFRVTRFFRLAELLRFVRLARIVDKVQEHSAGRSSLFFLQRGGGFPSERVLMNGGCGPFGKRTLPCKI